MYLVVSNFYLLFLFLHTIFFYPYSALPLTILFFLILFSRCNTFFNFLSFFFLYSSSVFFFHFIFWFSLNFFFYIMLSSMLFSFRVLSSLFYFLIVKYFHVFHVLYFFFILHIFVFFMFFQISSSFFHTFIPFRGPPAFYISPPPFLTSSSSICDTRYSIANQQFSTPRHSHHHKSYLSFVIWLSEILHALSYHPK